MRTSSLVNEKTRFYTYMNKNGYTMQLGLYTKKPILINIQKKITIDKRVFVPKSFALREGKVMGPSSKLHVRTGNKM